MLIPAMAIPKILVDLFFRKVSIAPVRYPGLLPVNRKRAGMKKSAKGDVFKVANVPKTFSGGVK